MLIYCSLPIWNMERRIIGTADGSATVSIPALDLTYHSRHGAVQESKHVFLQAGWQYWLSENEGRSPRLLEMGLGTGLNLFLTAIEASKSSLPVHYTALETAPLLPAEAAALNYPGLLGEAQLFARLHEAPWERDVPLLPHFTLHKTTTPLERFEPSAPFDIIYFDAFAPSAQPELWTEAIFTRLYNALHPGGVLVTYCSKGSVRRALQGAGFRVSKLAGPPGKREMVRAKKEG
jgi:tRNA U34 5-methylaminomethyl-2-thiouridine-forming methyltransferase MnmC